MFESRIYRLESNTEEYFKAQNALRQEFRRWTVRTLRVDWIVAWPEGSMMHVSDLGFA